MFVNNKTSEKISTIDNNFFSNTISILGCIVSDKKQALKTNKSFQFHVRISRHK